MNKKQFLKLLDKYLAGKASSDEEELLYKVYQSFQDQDPVDEPEADILFENKLFERLKQTIVQSETNITHKANHLGVWRFTVAASIIIPITLCLTYFILSQPIKTNNHSFKTTSKNDFKAGGNNAYLVLANGKVVPLNQAGTGVLARQGRNIIIKKSDGQIVYNQNEPNKSLKDSGQVNKIIVPIGGQYKVTLPDGTNVWINAASSLEYPVQFAGSLRKVKLIGEAYFEVSKDKHKTFVVNVNNKMNVSVRGTHFNITAYNDEDNISTTLLEGSVKIEDFIKPANNTMLKTGQQAIMLNNSGGLKVKSVDVDEAVAWQQGQFLFNNENIHSIMRKLSRWYNVDVVYAKDMKDKNFDGSISKYKNISAVLKLMELTKAVHFEFQGRRILVMP